MQSFPAGALGAAEVPTHAALLEFSSLERQFVGEPAQLVARAVVESTIIDSDVKAGVIAAPKETVLEKDAGAVSA